MTPVLTAICSLLIISEFIFVPLYLKKMWPTKSWGSLTLKMICATAYLALAAVITASVGIGRYSSLMLGGFICSWLGDFALHIPKPSKLYFSLGTVFFAAAHVCYCVAYIYVQRSFFPEVPVFYWWEIVLTAAIVAVYFTVCLIRRVPFGILAVPMVPYAFFVTVMTLKSTSLAVRLLCAQGVEAVIPAVLLLLGGLLFIQSDASLALLTVDTRYKKFRLKVYNIITYFAAQICLALTVLFIR